MNKLKLIFILILLLTGVLITYTFNHLIKENKDLKTSLLSIEDSRNIDTNINCPACERQISCDEKIFENLSTTSNQTIAKLIAIRFLEKKILSNKAFEQELDLLKKLTEGDDFIQNKLSLFEKYKNSGITSLDEIIRKVDYLDKDLPLESKVEASTNNKLIGQVVNKIIRIESTNNLEKVDNKKLENLNIIKTFIVDNELDKAILKLNDLALENIDHRPEIQSLINLIDDRNKLINYINQIWEFYSLSSIK
ncbi:MAG: hypothetical protein J0H68_04530 [Sphingobacteriia bacterium]|nr:hypothetical protein [Sphingobacteriia bacterium]